MSHCVTFLMVAVSALLLGCKTHTQETYGGMVLGKMGDSDRLECLSKGGEIYIGGIAPTELCALPTTDGGKACSRASDCETYCLAKTRTCNALRQSSACYDFLDEDGNEQAICYD